MARLPRYCPPGIPQHVIQRGNNRQCCFLDDKDFAAYALWLAEAANRFNVAVHAWVLMHNHVHVLASPQEEGALSLLMQDLGRRYVRYFNLRHGRSGTLWEGRYKSCVIKSESYLLLCQRYIELNPVRAGTVCNPGDYRWSSYQHNGLGKPSRCCTPHGLYLMLGRSTEERSRSYRALFDTHFDEDSLRTIRKAVHAGLSL